MKLRALLLSAAILAVLPASHAFAQTPSYRVVDLGADGGYFASGTGINSQGWVSGYGFPPSNAGLHALQWRLNDVIDLGTLGGENSSLQGSASGFSEKGKPDPLGQDFCDYGTHLICVPVVLNGTKLTALPTLGGYNGAAYANNNAGQTVGMAQTPGFDSSCPSHTPQAPYYSVQPFVPALWQNGQVKQLPLLPGDVDGVAMAINPQGWVAGSSGNCTNTYQHAWLWKGDQVINLGNFGGGDYNVGYGVNDIGEVTGTSSFPGGFPFHAFLWSGGSMTDLGTLPGDLYSYGFSINSYAQIVGLSCGSGCRPFLWENGAMFDLNELIPASSNLYLSNAFSIDDKGQIVGYAEVDGTGNYVAYQLNPGPPTAPVVVTVVDAHVRSGVATSSAALHRGLNRTPLPAKSTNGQ